MDRIRKIALEIVAREGGFVNDPDDLGGLTNHGVTLATLRRLGCDITGDSRVDAKDIEALSRDQAVDIFVRHFFTEPGLDGLPEPLQAPVFDMFVNSGGNAIRILQRLLNDMGQDLVVDGHLGPQTLRAAHWAHTVAPDHLADAYGIARRNYYYELGDARPASRKYARRRDGGKGGWITRAEAFIDARYRLSLEQHRARVAAWA